MDTRETTALLAIMEESIADEAQRLTETDPQQLRSQIIRLAARLTGPLEGRAAPCEIDQAAARLCALALKMARRYRVDSKASCAEEVIVLGV